MTHPSGAGPATFLQRLEARAERKRRRLVIAALSVIVAAAIGIVAYFSPIMALRSVSVDGTELTDPQQVEQAVIGEYSGTPLPQLRLGAIGDELHRTFTTTKSVSLRWSGMSSVHVTVTDRQPVLAVAEAGQWRRFDEDGQEIDRVDEHPDIPVLQAADTHPESVAAAVRLLEQLSDRDISRFSAVYVYSSSDVRIDYVPDSGSAESGEQAQTSSEKKVQIRFGTPDDAGVKLDGALALIDRADEYVDVSVPDRPVTK